MNIPLPKAIVTYHLPENWISLLNGKCQLIMASAENRGFSDELIKHLPDAQGILTLLTDRVDENILGQTPKLKVVSNMAVGVDNIDVTACTKRGIPVGHTPGVLTDATADLAMALVLSSARNFQQAGLDAKEGRWGPWVPTQWLGKDLKGATFGIVGLGKIGKAVAERAKAFGVTLIYTSRSPKPETAYQLGATFVSFGELLQKSDYIVLTVDLNPSTQGLINAEALQTMKPTAILVNVSRGPVVDTDAVVKALQEKWISGAALDVTDPEPLPPSHPLYKLQNCLIMPHIGSATENTRRQMAELACANLVAGLEGKPLIRCVNPGVYES